MGHKNVFYIMFLSLKDSKCLFNDSTKACSKETYLVQFSTSKTFLRMKYYFEGKGGALFILVWTFCLVFFHLTFLSLPPSNPHHTPGNLCITPYFGAHVILYVEHTYVGEILPLDYLFHKWDHFFIYLTALVFFHTTVFIESPSKSTHINLIDFFNNCVMFHCCNHGCLSHPHISCTKSALHAP